MIKQPRLEEDIRGLDRLELPFPEQWAPATRLWRAAWPKLLAAAIALGLWQVVVWTGWKAPFVLPPPSRVFQELGALFLTDRFWMAVGTTLRRAAVGYAVAVGLGTTLGLAVSQSSVFRRAVGSLITGLQSMPSIVWFPFAILLFGISETAIFFVVVLGAAPSIANGLISGVDHIPPVLLRGGVNSRRVRGATSWRHVILPAASTQLRRGSQTGLGFRLAVFDGRGTLGDHRGPSINRSAARDLPESYPMPRSWSAGCSWCSS